MEPRPPRTAGAVALAVLLAAAGSAQEPDGLAAAEKLYAAGKYAGALAAYRVVLEADPDATAAYSGAGKCLIALNRIPDALALMQEAVKRPGADAENHAVLGQAYYWDASAVLGAPRSPRAGFLPLILADAERSLRRAVALDAKLHVAHFYLGKVRMRLNKFPEAAASFLEAAKLAPRRFRSYIAEAYRDAAVCFDRAGDAKGTREALRAGFRFDPESNLLFQGIWSIYGGKKERRGEGVEVLKTLARARPSAPLPLYYLGYFYQAMGRKAGARKAFEKVVATAGGKKFSTAWAVLGEIYFVEDGDLKRAERCARKALQLDPGNAKASRTLAYLVSRAVQERDIPRAIELTRTILRYQPNNGKQWGILAGFYHNQRRLKEALKYYTRAMKLAPKDPDPRAGAGKIMNDLRRFKEAERLFKEALALDPSHIDTRMQLGYLYRRLNRVAEAIAQCEKILEIKPGHRPAQALLDSLR